MSVAACGESTGDGGGGDTPDASTEGCGLTGSGTADLNLKGSCDQTELLGSILLERQQDFSFLDGKVANKVLPGSVREVEMNMAGCRLMRKRFPFCDPGCQSGEACTFAGECVPFPERQDLGEVCVAGLSESYVLTAQEPNFHYFNTQIVHPAFGGGERVELRSSGGAFGNIALLGVGVSAMSVSESQWNIVEGEDLDVSWATSDSDAHASVHLSVNIDQHGSSPLLLDCDFPDSGSGTIPSALLEVLLNSGISGFPVGRIERRTADLQMVSGANGIEGCVEFIVRSPATVDLRVSGHTPCTSNAQCPSGQTCNTQMETCQ